MKLSANAAHSLVASQSFHPLTSKSSNMPELEASTKHPEVQAIQLCTADGDKKELLVVLVKRCS